MRFREKPQRKDPSKSQLVLRGAIAVALLFAVIVYTTIASTGATSGYPEITAAIPASNSGIREQTSVEYKGVIVGKVIKVSTSESTSTLTIRVYDRQAAGISSESKVRILPRTLFGDQFVQLVPPAGSVGHTIEDGDVLAADDSAGTIQLYAAYVRLTDLLAQVKPEKISSALAAMSQLLDGRGEKFGKMIDQVYDLTGDVPALLKLADDGMIAAKTLSEHMVRATPDGISALRDAVALSKTLVAERDTLERMLVSGVTLSRESSRLLGGDNIDRAVQLMRATDPVVDTIAARPGALPKTIGAVRKVAELGIPLFESGPWFKIRASLTRAEPYPYNAPDDCPRYPGLAGPNCGGASAASQRSSAPDYGGTAGSVGSPSERDTLAEIMGAAPGTLSTGLSGASAGVFGVLLGPVVRGTRVIVP